MFLLHIGWDDSQKNYNKNKIIKLISKLKLTEIVSFLGKK